MCNLFKKSVLVIGLCLASFTALAQNALTVTGKVADESG